MIVPAHLIRQVYYCLCEEWAGRLMGSESKGVIEIVLCQSKGSRAPYTSDRCAKSHAGLIHSALRESRSKHANWTAASAACEFKLKRQIYFKGANVHFVVS
jgi:hypothetical protein